jgi:hypothetical protein
MSSTLQNEHGLEYKSETFGTTSTSYLGPKKWADCSADEKLERLRSELDGWRRECARLRERVTVLEQHQHNAAGDMVVPVQGAANLLNQEASCGSINLL